MALKYDDLLNTQYNYSGLGKTFAKDLSNVFLANEMEEALKKRKEEEQQQEEEKEQKESFSGSGEIGLASMIAPLEMPSSQSELIEIPTDVPGETEIVRINGLSSLNPQNVQEQTIEQERQPQAGLNLLSPSVLEESEEMEEPMVSFEEMANSIKDREKIQKYFNIPLDVDLLQSSLMYDAFQGKQPGTTAQEMVREYNDILREENALIQAEDNREYQRMKDAYQAKRQERLDKENIKKSKLEREDKLREALIKAQKPSDLQQEIDLLKQYGATNEEIRNHLLNKGKGYQATSIDDKIKLEDVKQKNKLELQKLKNKNKIQEQNTKKTTVTTKGVEEFKKVANRFLDEGKKNNFKGIGPIQGSPLIKSGLNIISPKGIGTNEANLDAINKKMVELTREKLTQMGVKSGEINSATEQALYLYKLNPNMNVEQIEKTIKNFIDDYSSKEFGRKKSQQQVGKYTVKVKTKGE